MRLRSIVLPLCVVAAPLPAFEPLDTSPPKRDLRNVDPSGILANRATPDSREAARVKAGFPPATQPAVDKALAYLLSTQNKDGSWGDRDQVSTTSLALLAFLGNGASPVSKKFGEGITRGILYLVDISEKEKGRLGIRVGGRLDSNWPREHALGLQALAESHLVCSKLGVKLPGLKDAVQVGAQWVIDSAHKHGGWALRFDEAGPVGADLGMTVPSLHALWLVHLAGVETRNANRQVNRALALMERLQTPGGAVQFSKLAHRTGYPWTGGAAFSFRIANRAEHEVPRKAIADLEIPSHVTFKYKDDRPNLLSFHYDALAVLHFAGKNWESWYQESISDLLKHQSPDGSFVPRSDEARAHPRAAALQRSSIACLILETPYRYQLAK